MSELLCISCGKIRDKGRKMCRECYLAHKSKRGKELYQQKGRHNYGDSFCIMCGKEIHLWRKTQKLCWECSTKPGDYQATDNYVYVGNEENLNNWAHRRIAEQILSRKLTEHEIVHHVDENPKNNELNNLLIISREMHGKLHYYLRIQRAILKQFGNENLENCWNSLRVPMTTAWLEMTGAKVTKLWEISQSAAEPLSSKEYEEGSETMHQTSLVDEDIVQTATEMA